MKKGRCLVDDLAVHALVATEVALLGQLSRSGTDCLPKTYVEIYRESVVVERTGNPDGLEQTFTDGSHTDTIAAAADSAHLHLA